MFSLIENKFKASNRATPASNRATPASNRAAPASNRAAQGIISWQKDIESNGLWGQDCYFPGGTINMKTVNLISREQCMKECFKTNGCTHFSWNSRNGATCRIKNGAVTTNDAAYQKSTTEKACGIVNMPR